MSLNVYLFFNGTCEEAMNYYRDATGGSIESLVRYGDTSMPASEAFNDKIMHSVMLIHDTRVMFSDAGEHRVVTSGNNFSISLDFNDEGRMRGVFAALSGGGTVTMPLQDTFWGAVFGMCTDKFGVNWMFNYNRPQH